MKRLHIILYICLLSLNSMAQTEGFSVDTLSDAVFLRMQGKSYPEGCSVMRCDLRYLQIRHYDAEGKVHRGELVCNKKIADDERSMTANNTSCFCFRKIAGSSRLSKHSLGTAIDINPLQNPCVKKRKDGSLFIQPKAAHKYADRQKAYPYKIMKGDLCYRLFLAHGFSWGGNWRTLKDYQHFEK